MAADPNAGSELLEVSSPLKLVPRCVWVGAWAGAWPRGCVTMCVCVCVSVGGVGVGARTRAHVCL